MLIFLGASALSHSKPSAVSYNMLALYKGVTYMGYNGGGGYASGFALIVVLFILLIIVGAAYVGY